MPHLTFHLADLISNPDESVDFARLDPGEIDTHLASTYGFLGPGVEITVENESVTLAIPDPHPFQVGEADRTLKRAQRAAEKGNYTAAAQIYKEVLASLPAQARTRRDLAMV